MAFIVSCTKEEKQVRKVAPKSVSISGLFHGIAKGESKQLVAYVLPNNAQNKEVEWTSSAPEKISVDKNGLISAKGNVGDSAEITVTTKEGRKSFKSLVEIKNLPKYKLATALTIYPPAKYYRSTGGGNKALIINSGQEVFIPTTLGPQDATDKNLTWSVADDSIAKVVDGVVMGIKTGTTTIKVKVKNADTETQNNTKSFSVQVKDPVAVTGINFTGEQLYVAPGQETGVILLYQPQDATYKKVRLQSNNTDLVTVLENGNIKVAETAPLGSSVTLTATAVDTIGADVKVKDNGVDVSLTTEVQLVVVPQPIAITKLSLVNRLNTEDKILLTKQAGTNKQKLFFHREPALTTQRALTFVSNDTNVVSVDADGELSAVEVGNTSVDVAVKDNPDIKLRVSVQVIEKPIYISSLTILPSILSSTKLTDAENPTKNLEIIQLGTDGADITHNDLVLISQNPSIATVEKDSQADNKYKVSFQNYGSTRIWAISDKGLTSVNSVIDVININKTTIDAQDPDKAKKEQIERSVARVAINAKGLKFPNYDYKTHQKNKPKVGWIKNYPIFFHIKAGKDLAKLPEDLVNPSDLYEIKDNFEIGQTEVTYKIWEAVRVWATTPQQGNASKRLADGGAIYKFKNNGDMGSAGARSDTQNIMYGTRDLQPVTNITWKDAIVWSNAYTEWLNANEKTNYKLVYYPQNTTDFTDESIALRDATIQNVSLFNATANPNADGIRLPTKEEWEFVAALRPYQAADPIAITGANDEIIKVTIDGKDYAFTKGNALMGASTLPTTKMVDGAEVFDYPETKSKGYFRNSTVDMGKSYTQDVGLITATTNPCDNAFKICDMNGNVFELVYGGYFKYSHATHIQMYKGLSYFYLNIKAGIASVATVQANGPPERTKFPDLGFRIARSIK